MAWRERPSRAKKLSCRPACPQRGPGPEPEEGAAAAPPPTPPGRGGSHPPSPGRRRDRMTAAEHEDDSERAWPWEKAGHPAGGLKGGGQNARRAALVAAD